MGGENGAAIERVLCESDEQQAGHASREARRGNASSNGRVREVRYPSDEGGRDVGNKSAIDLRLPLDDGTCCGLMPAARRHIAWKGLLFVCADTAMGKTFLLHQIIGRAKQNHRSTWYFTLSGLNARMATERLCRIRRDFQKRARERRNAVVCLDDLPASDEMEIERQAQALTGLVELGYKVVAAFRMDDEQLCEALPEAPVIRAMDLRYRKTLQDPGSMLAWERTHGIPGLLHALSGDCAMGSAPPVLGMKYIALLRRVLSNLLEGSLAREERASRIALMLLGRGTFDEAHLVCRRCDGEFFLWAQDQSPFFGIDLQRRSFACAGLSEHETLSAILDTLEPLVASFDGLVGRACELLMGRHDVRRAALVCALSPTRHQLGVLGCRYGVSFCEAGSVGVVREATRSLEAGEAGTVFGYAASSLALASLEEPYGRFLKVREGVLARLGRLGESRGDVEVALLQAACREVLHAGEIPLYAHGFGQTANARLAGLRMNLEVTQLMIEGRFSKARGMAEDHLATGVEMDLPRAMLMTSYVVADVLCGGTPDLRDGSPYVRSRSFLASSDVRRMGCYQRNALGVLRALMGWPVATSALEEMLAHAEKSGDNAVLVWMLLAAAVGDIRNGLLKYALVRAAKAISLARGMKLTHVEHEACFVEAFARALAGETGHLETLLIDEAAPVFLRRLALMAARAMGVGTHAASEYADQFDQNAIPPDYLWVLCMVMGVEGDFSRRLEQASPSLWRNTYRKLRACQEELFGRMQAAGENLMVAQAGALGERGTQLALRLTPEAVSDSADCVVRICLFGGLRVAKRGEDISDRLLKRRRAHLFLTLLALSRGHSLRRTQVLEEIWGESETPANARRIYEVLSVVRSLLGDKEHGIDPIITNSATRTLTLDAQVVSCDIDEFEQEAQAVLIADDDMRAILHARTMLGIYGEGLVLDYENLSSIARHRAAELEQLFADACVIASEACLRTGATLRAVRFATAAHTVDSLREDAVRTLIVALGQSGRSSEVAQVYRHYCEGLIDAQGMPPSPALRRIVEGILRER